MKKYNYVLLGVAIAYLFIAFFQLKTSTPLNASFYITISFLSLDISFFEVLKSIAKKFYSISELYISTIDNNITLIKEKIKTIEICNGSETHKKDLELQLSDFEKKKEIEEKSKKIIFVRKVESVLTVFQIILCTCLVIISPLKVIPYDNFSIKSINFLSIISFAFLFLSLFFSSLESEKSKR